MATKTYMSIIRTILLLAIVVTILPVDAAITASRCLCDSGKATGVATSCHGQTGICPCCSSSSSHETTDRANDVTLVGGMNQITTDGLPPNDQATSIGCSCPRKTGQIETREVSLSSREVHFLSGPLPPPVTCICLQVNQSACTSISKRPFFSRPIYLTITCSLLI